MPRLSAVGIPFLKEGEDVNRRFGPLPAELAMRVQQASREQLMLWGDRLLDAASLEQVFAEPAH